MIQENITTEDVMPHFSAQQLAIEFAREIREALTPAQLTEANRLNDAEPGGAKANDVCHTHDHIDANECMIAAWEKLGGSTRGMFRQTSMDKMNQAWGIAKEAHFTPKSGARKGGALGMSDNEIIADPDELLRRLDTVIAPITAAQDRGDMNEAWRLAKAPSKYGQGGRK